MIRKPLSKEDVIKAIERKGVDKIPLVFHKWWGNGLQEKYGAQLEELASDFPDDIFVSFYSAPGEDVSPVSNPHYRWGYRNDYSNVAAHSIGEHKELLPDWDELDPLINDFPDPNEPGNFNIVEKDLEKAGGRYKLGGWWFFLHERLWSIRGMENLMIDYYDDMDKLKILGRKIIDYHKVIVDRYAALGFDGIFTSDDLGHQTGPMMSPEIFKEFYLPLYSEFVGYVHQRGMHMFLHSCGNNSKLMDYLIDAGLDVLHPIQKGCMDEAETVAKYGDKITFLAGVDVQHLIPNGSVDQVREGIRELIQTMYRPEGGLLLAAGNGILKDTPLENIKAMLEEMTKGYSR